MKKYYSGPGGVFYNPRMDCLFYLEPTGVEIMNRKFKIIGKQYKVFAPGIKSSRASVTGMDKQIRLGEL